MVDSLAKLIRVGNVSWSGAIILV